MRTTEVYDTLPKKRSDLEFAPYSNDVVVHDRKNAAVHVLNATAKIVLDHCDGVTTLDACLDDLKLKFEGYPADALVSHVREALASFAEQNLLEPDEGE